MTSSVRTAGPSRSWRRSVAGPPSRQPSVRFQGLCGSADAAALARVALARSSRRPSAPSARVRGGSGLTGRLLSSAADGLFAAGALQSAVDAIAREAEADEELAVAA